MIIKEDIIKSWASEGKEGDKNDDDEVPMLKTNCSTAVIVIVSNDDDHGGVSERL